MKYAFSTKIADTLSSGTCFFYYAPDEFVSQKYLSNNKAAITVTDKDNLQESLESALIDQELREKTVFNAKKLFNLNHNYKTNQQKFYNILEKVVHECNSN